MNRKVFLTSEGQFVAEDIGKKLRAKEKKLKLLFIDTAAEIIDGDKEWLRSNKKGVKEAGFELVDFTLTGKSKVEVKEAMESADGVHVEGGSVVYLRYQMQESGFDELVGDFLDDGKIYMSTSAGSIVTGPEIMKFYVDDDNRKWADKLISYNGLGLTNFLVFPHWGRDDFRRAYLEERVESAYDADYPILLLNDNQYVEIPEEGFKVVDVRRDG